MKTSLKRVLNKPVVFEEPWRLGGRGMIVNKQTLCPCSESNQPNFIPLRDLKLAQQRNAVGT